jgi:hypothetical protein
MSNYLHFQTTFFVATESSWLVIVIPSSTDRGSLSTIGQLANISILSAIIVHGFAGGFFSFSFYLLTTFIFLCSYYIFSRRILSHPT